jgi:hypothetical protein
MRHPSGGSIHGADKQTVIITNKKTRVNILIPEVCTQKLSEGKREIGTMLGKGLPLTA